MSKSQLPREQQALEKVWEEHLASEFKFKNAKAAINTMVERPSVNHVPVMTGGVGRKQLKQFYDQLLLPQILGHANHSCFRTIDHDRLVDEFVIKLPIACKRICCCPEFHRRISRLKSRS